MKDWVLFSLGFIIGTLLYNLVKHRAVSSLKKKNMALAYGASKKKANKIFWREMCRISRR